MNRLALMLSDWATVNAALVMAILVAVVVAYRLRLVASWSPPEEPQPAEPTVTAADIDAEDAKRRARRFRCDRETSARLWHSLHEQGVDVFSSTPDALMPHVVEVDR
jgi:hypothetical protein